MSVTTVSAPRSQTTVVQDSAKQDRLGAATISLGLLLASFFYCLPLGRYQLAGFSSDFRIYDYVFPLAVILTAGHLHRITAAWRNRTRFFFWARLVAVISWISLIMTAYFGGFELLLPAVIRAYRWTAYLLTPALIFAVATTPRRQQFLFKVFFFSIVIQALLAFLQGLHLAPHLWPDYWISGYGAGGMNPVGTLSPHHKQIGVVMMIGVAMSLTFARTSPGLLSKTFYIWLMMIMIIVIVFSGARSAWLGLLVLTVAYCYLHRERALPVISIFAIAGTMFWLGIRGYVEDPLNEKINLRMAGRVEKLGIEGVVGERTAIYFGDIPAAIQENPAFVITGAGFQGISAVMSATGAHNNYLQALLELGVIGFLIYLKFLGRIIATLRETVRLAGSRFERSLATDCWALFIGILATMLVGESLWAQYSMFTLSGQIMAAMALAVCPLNWAPKLQPRENSDRAISVR